MKIDGRKTTTSVPLDNGNTLEISKFCGMYTVKVVDANRLAVTELANLVSKDEAQAVASNFTKDIIMDAKTFTLYRADILDQNKSGSLAVFDTIYYLDRDMDWDTYTEYELPTDWQFVDGGDDDFSYLVTETNQIIDARNIMHYKTEGVAGTWYIGKGGMVKVLFKPVTPDI